MVTVPSENNTNTSNNYSIRQIIELLRDDLRYTREAIDSVREDVADVRERLGRIEGSARVWGGMLGAITGFIVSSITRIFTK